MTSQRVTVTYKTPSIDLASYLLVKGHIITTTAPPGEHRATFEMEQALNLFQDIADFESGTTAPAKRLLNARSRLFREASAAVRSGGER